MERRRGIVALLSLVRSLPRSLFIGVGAVAGAVLVPVSLGDAQESDRTGGDLTSTLPYPLSVQVAAPNVTDQERRILQGSGFAPFHHLRTPEEGLGPRFINNSCGGCHVSNGRGPAALARSNTSFSQMVVKVRVEGRDPSGAAKAAPGVGTQVLDQDISGAKAPRAKVSWEKVTGKYPDGFRYELRRPVVTVSSSTKYRGRIRTSLRMSPPLVGLGLLESVPWESLAALSVASDARAWRVSGRLNWVRDARTGQPTVGRFGFKANQPTVEQQTAVALYNDMQISNPIFHEEGEIPEASEEELAALTVYQKLGGVPAAVSEDSAELKRGRRVFFDVGCEVCHRSILVTGVHSDLELRKQTFHPFTDLLLHDMGEGLADGWSEDGASGREWRTTPLWGLHVLSDRSKASVYLHDGRARTLEEAILWHDGEASRARRRFISLEKGERDALIQYLRSL